MLKTRILAAESELETREEMLSRFSDSLTPSEHQHGLDLLGATENQNDIDHEI